MVKQALLKSCYLKWRRTFSHHMAKVGGLACNASPRNSFNSNFGLGFKRCPNLNLGCWIPSGCTKTDPTGQIGWAGRWNWDIKTTDSWLETTCVRLVKRVDFKIWCQGALNCRDPIWIENYSDWSRTLWPKIWFVFKRAITDPAQFLIQTK